MTQNEPRIHLATLITAPPAKMNQTQLDQELLTTRDRLELRAAQGDHRFDWLLAQVKQRISEQARQACLEAEK